ncbi:MAG: DUF433 domain-containing protein [Bacteroidetes bacterium]|nr:DUF433 domain-containing protein [Bacteroidota bacterium]MBU1718017.1 DUF433 domain-containing protein [Bacteroidota bacterium]
MESLRSRVTIDSGVCNGRPSITGKRVTVNTIVEYLSAGDTVEDIIQAYPKLERDDIYACLQFGADLMSNNYQIKPVA